VTLQGPRILTLGLDRTAKPPQPLVHIVDARGSRRGTLDDAQAFLDELRADIAPKGRGDVR
jgi:hypothetical protein